MGEGSFKDITCSSCFRFTFEALELKGEKGEGKMEEVHKMKYYIKIWYDKRTTHNKVPIGKKT